MAGETQITIVGNLVADPELRSTQSGISVASFTIASTPRTFDRTANEWKDGEALFLRCSAWRELAEHVAASLPKGARVIAQGNLTQRSYKDKEGNDRTSIELEVIEIGPSLRYATAQVTRTTGQGGGQQPAQQPIQPQLGYGVPQGQYGPPQGVQQPAQQFLQPQQGYPAPQGGPVQQPQPQQQGYPAPRPQPAAQPQQQWAPQPSGFDQPPF